MPARWPMVGRGAELTAMRAALRQGTGIVLLGEPGVGKTMLLDELRRHLDREGRPTRFVLASAASQITSDDLGYQMDQTAPGAATTVLLVDDAQLLDTTSAAALWQLVGTGQAVVVATARAGEELPTDVERLWTSDRCTRLDLGPLDEPEVRTLLESVLGGDVEDRLVRLLFTRAGGNPLLLRELLRSGVDSGALRRRHQVWSLTGDLPLGAGVRDLIGHALAGLTPQQRRSAQLLAFGEPIALPIARTLVDESMLEELEAQHLVTLQDTVDGAVVTLGHPLYGELLRADTAPLRSRAIGLELADAFERAPLPHGHRDVVRAILWRVAAETPVDTAVLLETAGIARAFSSASSERLARAAVDAGDTVDAPILLASLLTMRGDVQGAQDWLDRVTADGLTTEQNAEIISVLAFIQTQASGLSEAATAISRLAANSAHSTDQLAGIHAQALTFDGRLAEGAALAGALFDDVGNDDPTRALAAMALIAGAHFTGQVAAADRIRGEAEKLAETVRDRLPYAAGTMAVAHVIALAHAGRLTEAGTTAEELYERALGDDDPWLRPRGASALGVVALVRGQVRTAARYFRIAVASLNEFDRLFLRYNLAYLARATALCGTVEEAERALRSGHDAPVFRTFEDDWDLARATVLAARGEYLEATELAIRTAHGAAGIGSWTLCTIAVHDAARYGGRDLPLALVAEAAAHTDGPLTHLMAEQVAATAVSDALRLDLVAAHLHSLGADLVAAEASYAAGAAHRSSGAPDAAAASLATAISLHAGCEGAVMPWTAPHEGGVLTVREQQVAVLAAAGRTDAQIAAELGIATRTVSTHLTNVYGKLAISTRRDLGAILTGASEQHNMTTSAQARSRTGTASTT